MDLGLQGKVVMVTGGAGRIGPVICAIFAREGAAVGVLDVAADRATATAARLRESGAQAIGVGVDVSRVADVSAALQEVTTALGPHGIRVNAVSPGLVTDVPLRTADASLTQYMQMMLDMTPLGPYGRARRHCRSRGLRG